VILGRVVVSRRNLNLGTTRTTGDKIALRALLEKGSDTTFLREMIAFAAERLMELETETLCNAAPVERSADRSNQRNGYRDRDWQTRAGAAAPSREAVNSDCCTAKAALGRRSSGRQV
jgi:hypothetical protein